MAWGDIPHDIAPRGDETYLRGKFVSLSYSKQTPVRCYPITDIHTIVWDGRSPALGPGWCLHLHLIQARVNKVSHMNGHSPVRVPTSMQPLGTCHAATAVGSHVTRRLIMNSSSEPCGRAWIRITPIRLVESTQMLGHGQKNRLPRSP
jgi:hypothetical protein